MSLELNFGDAIVKAAPIGGVVATDVAARIFGLTLNEWFYVAAIGYVCVQGWALIYKTLKEVKNE